MQRIFTGPLADFTIFKGGTALSKCFSVINRFSEDIDLVLVKEPHLSANQLKERLKRISQAVSGFLPEVEIVGITNKKGMIRKTAHAYGRNKIVFAAQKTHHKWKTKADHKSPYYTPQWRDLPKIELT